MSGERKKDEQKKTAFAAIVGRPNVGKSSILNALLGQKVAAVSPKPQTTRTRIMGVLTENNVQLVFTDTPGLHRPKTRLGDYMVRAVNDSVAGVDFSALVVEAYGGETEIPPAETRLIEQFSTLNQPAILVINKIDRLERKELIAERIARYAALFDFAAVIPVSALRGTGMDALKSELMDMAQPGPWFFPGDALTDQPERVLAAEMIREAALRLLSDEIPHGVAVDIELMRERVGRDDLMDIRATIYCERESHKGIIIGKGGAMLKRIGGASRAEIERFLGVQANLELWVKVREGWRNRENSLRMFGYGES